jgi:hypothetical protein
VFGSIVQKGKLAAAALAEVSALKMVDLPTFGRPTIPQVKPMRERIQKEKHQLML